MGEVSEGQKMPVFMVMISVVRSVWLQRFRGRPGYS